MSAINVDVTKKPILFAVSQFSQPKSQPSLIHCISSQPLVSHHIYILFVFCTCLPSFRSCVCVVFAFRLSHTFACVSKPCNRCAHIEDFYDYNCFDNLNIWPAHLFFHNIRCDNALTTNYSSQQPNTSSNIFKIFAKHMQFYSMRNA